jgi:serine/threonine protein kinase
LSLTHLQNGRYAVLKKLGEGGKGVVYKARDTVLNHVVAIKILKTMVGEEAYSRFMREAQAVGRLNHPNVVTIYDIGKDEEKQFFVLEFVDGMSLREFEAMGARQWNMYAFARSVLYEHASMYLERNQEGDREKAHNLLNEALEIFQRIGAKKEVEMIIAKKKLLTS